MVPSLACPNICVAVMAAGGIPLIVDVSSLDGNISTNAVKSRIDASVKAIIAVDSFGYPADLKTLKEIASPYGCKVIDDACQAYGGSINGERVGCLGDMGVISFGYSKPIALQGGGLLIVPNKNALNGILELMRTNSNSPVSLFKNWLSLNLSLSSKYGLFKFLTNHGLLNYNFPEILKQKLHMTWQLFEQDLPAVKSNLKKAREIISTLNDIDTFDYIDGDWLPWRYSFMITSGETQDRFLRLSKKLHIKSSRFYKPLNIVSNKFLFRNPYPTSPSKNIFDSIFNLRYATTRNSTNQLIEKIKSFRKFW